MMKKPNNHVEAVAAKFGPYLADFATALDLPYTTVNSWAKRGSIPKWQRANILLVAEKLGIELTEEELKGPDNA